jgi:UDP-galactopyranose mutase
MNFDVVVVGSGLAGVVSANLLAVAGKSVLIIEKKSHIGGNTYDCYNNHGVLIQKYGPHIFRTNNEKVWRYLSRFTEWHYYQHKVVAKVKGFEVPFPINLDTYNALFGHIVSKKQFEALLQSFSITQTPKNAEEVIINQVGTDLYEIFFKNYMLKHWGIHPKQLFADAVKRVPVRTDRESRYFTHRYQGLPKYGYTVMINNMLDHENISILLQTDYKRIINRIKYKKMIYTAPLDYFFDFQFGALDYRSLYFEERTYDQESFQSHAVINYPNDYDYTRVTEYKKLTGQQHRKTTVHYEYPIPFDPDKNEPYYPILDQKNSLLQQKYLSFSKQLDKVVFIGRLAEYRYYAMDELVEKIITHKSGLLDIKE